jgi:hypothetical protein
MWGNAAEKAKVGDRIIDELFSQWELLVLFWVKEFGLAACD